MAERQISLKIFSLFGNALIFVGGHDTTANNYWLIFELYYILYFMIDFNLEVDNFWIRKSTDKNN